MQNRKLGYVLFALAASGAGCTFNGKPLFHFSKSSSLGGGDGDGGGGGGSSGSGGSASYAWCKNLKNNSSGNDAKNALDLDQEAYFALPPLLQALCYPQEEARGKRGALEAARQTWMKKLGLNDHDWATDIVAFGNLDYGARMGMVGDAVRGIGSDPDVPWSKAGPLEQFARFRSGSGNTHYLADALPLTEAGRLGLIARCMFLSGADDEPHPVEWAVCQPDIEALDLGKLGADIRSEAARSFADRMGVRLTLNRVQRHMPEHERKVKLLVTKDPAYAKLFEIAKSMRKDWSTISATRADLLALMRAMEEAAATGSRKPLDGCSARTWPAFASAVGKIPAKRFEGLPRKDFFGELMSVIFQDPDMYLAANALYACEGSADAFVARLGARLSAPFRGPRTAALIAIELARLTPKKRGEPIDVPSVGFPLGLAPSTRDTNRESREGIIATVTARGDAVRITFPASSELWSDCVSRRTTNRISKIDSNGDVQYESECTQRQSRRVDTTPKPVEVPKRYAAGLAPKRHVLIVDGILQAVWATAKSPAPLAAFGVLLK